MRNANRIRSSERRIQTKKSNKRSARISVLLLLSIILIVGLSVFKTTRAEETDTYHKYYKSITIHNHDTLWSIAEENIENGDEDITAYIAEVKKINHIGSSNIKTGMSIVVPYYAP